MRPARGIFPLCERFSPFPETVYLNMADMRGGSDVPGGFLAVRFAIPEVSVAVDGG